MLEHPNVIFFELFVDFEFVCGKRENVQTVIPTVVLSLIFLRVIWEIRRVRCLKTAPEDTLQVRQSFGIEKIIQERHPFGSHDYQLDSSTAVASPMYWMGKVSTWY